MGDGNHFGDSQLLSLASDLQPLHVWREAVIGGTGSVLGGGGGVSCCIQVPPGGSFSSWWGVGGLGARLSGVRMGWGCGPSVMDPGLDIPE